MKYSATAQKIIDGATLTYEGNTVDYGTASNTPALYMRVSNSKDAPSSENDWKQIDPSSTDPFGVITATGSGIRYIYFYVEANGSSYPDSGSDVIV